MKPIKQRPIRDRIHSELLRTILRGELQPGSKLKDSRLAEEFVVSRTPVRETLLRLEREGFVENRMGRGFVVRSLTRGEMEEVYPILLTLESFALRSSAPLPATKLRRLMTLAGRMNAGAKDPMENIDLDAGWHSTLLGGCGNEQLIVMIESLRARIYRYEYAYMQNAKLIERSISDHEAIARLLEVKKSEEAAALLEQHWKRSFDFLADRLRT